MMSPLSWIYEKISDLRNARYDSGRAAAFDLGARTISVGNITTGGTGKTPLVILIAEKLAARGKQVCILTRGYGRANANERVLVSDRSHVLVDARQGGDEPVELARALLQKAVVVADRDRVAAARWAREKFGITAFVLDDGFQHRRARREVDIVCIDAMNPFGNGKLLPAGRLREPLRNLKRADAVVLTRSDMVESVDELKAEVRRHNQECPIFTARSSASRLTEIGEFLSPAGLDAKSALDAGSLKQTKAHGFCGLGNPEAFFDQLRRDNFDIAATRSFRDHYIYQKADAAELARLAREAGASCLITTAKDAVKLIGMKFEIPCYVLEVRIAIDDDAGFSALL